MSPTASVFRSVFRIEAVGEVADPFPSLHDAMREPPSHAEGRIATSLYGVVLAEASLFSSSRKRTRQVYEWRVTVAGEDVLEGSVRGMPCWRVAS